MNNRIPNKILSKRYSNIDIYIGLLSSRHPTLPPPIQAHIDRLTEQIDELALQLAEERLNHKQTKLTVISFCFICKSK